MPVMVTVGDLAEQMHVSKNDFYAWAKRDEDPLPLRTMNGKSRSSAIAVPDWLAWFERNSTLFKEARNARRKSGARQ